MKNKVTLSDIAGELGISCNAVSLALRGKKGVSEELRKKVLDKAGQMNYNSKNKLKGTIVAFISQSNPYRSSRSFSFYQQLCFQMESYAHSLGYLFIICSVSKEEERNAVPHSVFNTISCSGIISIGDLSKKYCRMLNNMGLPYVMVNQCYEDLIVSSVNIANASGSYLLTQHLIDKGHRKIVFLGNDQKFKSVKERWNGYLQAMTENHLPILEKNAADIFTAIDSGKEEVLKKTLLSCQDKPTAFICGQHFLSAAIIEMMSSVGFSCPEDFSLVDFDNFQNFNESNRFITSYISPIGKLAKAAINILSDFSYPHPFRIQLYGEIIELKSVKSLHP